MISFDHLKIFNTINKMIIPGALVSLVIFSCFVATSYGVTFSSLQRTLIVTASPQQGQVLKAGDDTIKLTWSLDTTFPTGTDSSYHIVKFMLCYAPLSQKDRAWRRTEDDLDKDKTCQHEIVSMPYIASNNTFTWTVQKDVPKATYFVRAYVLNSHNEEVAFGQTTDSNKATNLFEIQAITGRHVSLDIASVCFSGFSIVSLFGFFFWEKRKAKTSQTK